MTTILGIESTAHTFGIGIVKNKKILANEKISFTTKKGGMIPMDVAKHHEKIKNKVYEDALKKSEIKEKDISAIAFSQSPGLAPCLLVGMKFAKKLSKKLKIPLIGVNHCIAHLEIGKITGAKDPVMLYVSGANTQVIAYESERYRIFGETLDLGVGNFIDTIARSMNLGFPGGPKIEELSKRGKYIELPYSVKGMDITLSGIQTKIRQLLKKRISKKDLAYSMQETIFAMLVEVAERALAHTGKNELLLGGGVACNKRLQKMCKIMCNERRVKFFCPENSLLIDNAGMIAYLGEIMFNSKKFREESLEKIDISPRERTDDVEVFWN